MSFVIAEDDPGAAEVQAVLAQHLAFARAVTPPCHVHALDVDGLLDPAVTFFSVRQDGVVVGVGALRRLNDTHVELKSMHVREAVRGHGVGRALVEHLVAVAAEQGYRRVSLQTGVGDTFAPAHRLYERAGFVPCEPFGDYSAGPDSRCMTRTVER